jgi:hypothetical protein
LFGVDLPFADSNREDDVMADIARIPRNTELPWRVASEARWPQYVLLLWQREWRRGAPDRKEKLSSSTGNISPNRRGPVREAGLLAQQPGGGVTSRCSGTICPLRQLVHKKDDGPECGAKSCAFGA